MRKILCMAMSVIMLLGIMSTGTAADKEKIQEIDVPYDTTLFFEYDIFYVEKMDEWWEEYQGRDLNAVFKKNYSIFRPILDKTKTEVVGMRSIYEMEVDAEIPFDTKRYLLCADRDVQQELLAQHGVEDKIKYSFLYDVNFFAEHTFGKRFILMIRTENEFYYVPIFFDHEEYRGVQNERVYTRDGFIKTLTREYKLVMFGEEIDCDVKPMGMMERILLPLRAYLEGLGYTVTWKGDTRDILFEYQGQKYRIHLEEGAEGDGTVYKMVDGKEVTTDKNLGYIPDVGYIIKNGRTMIWKGSGGIMFFAGWLERYERNDEYITHTDYDNCIIEVKTFKKPEN